MRNYVKSTKSILRAFDQECAELCYYDFIPDKVAESRLKLKKEAQNGPTKMENLKERLMHSLRDAFDPDKYDWDEASFTSEGEARGA